MYRNSQKRKNFECAIYFITSNTSNLHPFFKEDIFCELLIEDILFCREIKNFHLFAYKINYDHIHLLIQPNGTENYSKIMQNIKRVSALHINQIMFLNYIYLFEGENIYSRLQWTNNLIKYKERFKQKYSSQHKFPKFKWQKSFHDHIIRNDEDFKHHIQYIENQWIKHNYIENKFCFVDYELCGKSLMGF